MNKLFSFSFGLVLLATAAFAQSYSLTQTTLSTAITKIDGTSSGAVIQLASVTGVTAAGANNAINTEIVIDREAMAVIGVSGNQVTVLRGWNTTHATPHNSGAVVWVGPPSFFFDDSGVPGQGPSGACVRANELVLPHVHLPSGDIWDCVGATWQKGVNQPTTKPFTSFTTLAMPVAITATASTPASGKIWFSQLNVPVDAVLTGACLLNGATVGTDKVIYALYDSTGALVANTALAGVTTATASKYQCIPFTATVRVTGPQSYFIAAQGNGTADNYSLYATAGAPTNYATGSQTGVFATLAPITPTSTFTAAVGPIMSVY